MTKTRATLILIVTLALAGCAETTTPQTAAPAQAQFTPASYAGISDEGTMSVLKEAEESSAKASAACGTYDASGYNNAVALAQSGKLTESQIEAAKAIVAGGKAASKCKK